MVTFGYACNLVWIEHDPTKIPKNDSHGSHFRLPIDLLTYLWNFGTPFLFGTVGATVIKDDMKAGVIGWAFLIILIGLCTRVGVSILVTQTPKLTTKEALFLAFAWIPKTTV